MFTQFLLLVFIANVVTGDYDLHAQRASRRFQQPAHPEDGTTLGDTPFFSRSAWIALRNVDLLLQKRSNIFSNEMRVFFCKYNDTLYVKMAKLDIMVRLSNVNNVDTLLSELKEYIIQLDWGFYRLR